MLGQDRHDAEDQGQFPVARAGEIETDRVRVRRVDARHLGVAVAVVRPAALAQELEGEAHVRGRDRLAVREPGPRIEPEGDGGAVLRHLDRLRHERIQGKGLVERTPHQGLDQEARDAVRGGEALHRERVEAVEGALHAEHDAPALGSLGIDVGKVCEVAGEGRGPVHGEAVPSVLARGGRRRRHGQRGSGRKGEQGAGAPLRVWLRAERNGAARTHAPRYHGRQDTTEGWAASHWKAGRRPVRRARLASCLRRIP